MLDCGKSSLLYRRLVDEKKIFNSVSVELDNCELEGMLIISGFVSEGVDVDFAKNELFKGIDNFVEGISDGELTKAKNNLKMEYRCDLLDLPNVADAVANSFIVGDKNYINEYMSRIESVDFEKIKYLSRKIFFEGNKHTFIYKN